MSVVSSQKRRNYSPLGPYSLKAEAESKAKKDKSSVTFILSLSLTPSGAPKGVALQGSIGLAGE